MKQVHAIAIGNRGRGARGLQVRARVVMSTLSTVAGVAGLLAPAHTPEVDQSESRNPPHCDVKSTCEILSALFAFGAAIFWFYASWISRGSFFATPMMELDRVLKLQARYNAIAAVCAALAALLQIVVTRMPVCRAFG